MRAEIHRQKPDPFSGNSPQRRSVLTVAGIQQTPSGNGAPAIDVSQLVRVTCQLLAGAPQVQRVDVTLEPDRETATKMPLIHQARGIAREWDLGIYIKLQAGILRLTFIKQTGSDATALRNGNPE